jgi:hypothetical protein
MPWPTPQDYQEAVQNPGTAFDDAELRAARPEEDALGLPRAVTGGFASVYKLTAPSGRAWAVRCFLRDVPDQQKRYDLIGRELARLNLPYTTAFESRTRPPRVPPAGGPGAGGLVPGAADGVGRGEGLPLPPPPERPGHDGIEIDFAGDHDLDQGVTVAAVLAAATLLAAAAVGGLPGAGFAAAAGLTCADLWFLHARYRRARSHALRAAGGPVRQQSDDAAAARAVFDGVLAGAAGFEAERARVERTLRDDLWAERAGRAAAGGRGVGAGGGGPAADVRGVPPPVPAFRVAGPTPRHRPRRSSVSCPGRPQARSLAGGHRRPFTPACGAGPCFPVGRVGVAAPPSPGSATAAAGTGRPGTGSPTRPGPRR